MSQDNKLLLELDGKEVKCEILFTHHSEKFNKDYVVFLPEDNDQYSAARYVETGLGTGSIEPIETEEEWQLLEDLLNDYFDDQEEDDEEDANQ